MKQKDGAVTLSKRGFARDDFLSGSSEIPARTAFPDTQNTPNLYPQRTDSAHGNLHIPACFSCRPRASPAFPACPGWSSAFPRPSAAAPRWWWTDRAPDRPRPPRALRRDRQTHLRRGVEHLEEKEEEKKKKKKTPKRNISANALSRAITSRWKDTLTAQMEDGIARTDVRQECVAETLPLGGTFHQAGNVDHVQVRRHLAEKRSRRRKKNSLG